MGMYIMPETSFFQKNSGDFSLIAFPVNGEFLHYE